MGIRIIRDFTTSKWEGGTTTQLYLYPEEADFQKRDFLLRVSTATIEHETSVFSLMKGYRRMLMLLDGQTFLRHHGFHSVLLKPFDTDSFSGDWDTRSEGRCVDFNVIYRPELEPELKHVHLDATTYHSEHDVKLGLVYIVSGEGRVRGQSVCAGELVELKDEVLVNIEAETKMDLVIVGLDRSNLD